MSKETAALSSSTVEDISQRIGSVNISNDGGISAAVVCDMNSGEEDTISERNCTSCDQNLDSVKTNEIEADNTSSNTADSDMVQKKELNSGVAEVSICANCGKEGATNTCNKCKQVTYCNAACKKKHKSKHKADCEEHLRRAAELQEEELRRAAELYDEKLFKQPPHHWVRGHKGDCPICHKRLPILESGSRFQVCCGMVCCGCLYAARLHEEDFNRAAEWEELVPRTCPNCRAPRPNSCEEYMELLMPRVDAGDIQAMYTLGAFHAEGLYDLSQDYGKALELWEQTAEFGCADSIIKIGHLYYHGHGVEMDKKKARHYFELAAMRGCVEARHNLGQLECSAGSMDRAIKHLMIAIDGGNNDSLTVILSIYKEGYTSKDEYVKALRAYQKYLGEIKTSQRDKAAAFHEDYKYY